MEEEIKDLQNMVAFLQHEIDELQKVIKEIKDDKENDKNYLHYYLE